MGKNGIKSINKFLVIAIALLAVMISFSISGFAVEENNIKIGGDNTTEIQEIQKEQIDSQQQDNADNNVTNEQPKETSENLKETQNAQNQKQAPNALKSPNQAKLKHANRGLPIIDITLHGVDLKTINNGSKDTKYKGNDFQMTNTDGSIINASDLEVKGRGNSTWGLPKKPYQIKFDTKKDLLGMGESKKWVLLANYTDRTYRRNDIALKTAENIAFNGTKAGKPVELYVNNQYVGLYYLVHKVEIGKATLNLKNDNGILMEIDNLHGADGDPEFYSKIEKTHFVMKEAKEEKVQDTSVKIFENAYNKLEKDIYNADWNQISKEIDVDSFAKYYLLAEFSANPDGSRSSWYMYKDGDADVIHCGPAWDYDIAFGNNDVDWNSGNYRNANRLWSYNDKRVSNRNRTPEILTRLMDIPQFRNRVEQIYKNTVSVEIQNQINTFDRNAAAVKSAAEADRAKWHSKDNLSEKNTYLKKWMVQRKNFLDIIFLNRCMPSDGYYNLNIGGKTINDCRLQKQKDDSYVIYNSNNKVLDVAGASINNNTSVQFYEYNGTRAQKWMIYKINNNQFILMSACNNLFMTNSNNALKVSYYNQGNQKVTLAQKRMNIADAKISKSAIEKNEIAADPVILFRGAVLKKDVDYTLTKVVHNESISYTISGIGNYTGTKNFEVRVLGDFFQPEEGYYEISSSIKNGKVLDIKDNSVKDSANLQLYNKNDTWAQHFAFIKNTDGTYTIYVEGSRNVIDVSGGGRKNGTNIQQYRANKTAAQKWYIIDNGDGTVTFRSALDINKVMDVSGARTNNLTNIQLYSFNGTKAQKFRLSRKKDIVNVAGTKRILSSLNTSKAVDVRSASKNKGANVQLWANNGTGAQKFRFIKNNDGVYKIQNINSNMVLDVAGGSKLSGANVWQWSDNGTDAQKWILIQERNNVVIRSKCSGRVIDLFAARLWNGNNIQMWTWNGTGAQKWKIAE